MSTKVCQGFAADRPRSFCAQGRKRFRVRSSSNVAMSPPDGGVGTEKAPVPAASAAPHGGVPLSPIPSLCFRKRYVVEFVYTFCRPHFK